MLASSTKPQPPTDLKKDVMLKCVNEMMGRYVVEKMAKEHAAALEAAEANPEDKVKKEAVKVWRLRLEAVTARYSIAEARALVAIKLLQESPDFAGDYVDVPQSPIEFHQLVKEATADAKKDDAAFKAAEIDAVRQSALVFI
jgi:hypothetical protein